MRIEGGMSNNGVMQDALSLSIDEKQGLNLIDYDNGGGGDEVMVRRLKNRERQRRYRARKRIRDEVGIVDENLSFEETIGQELEDEEEEEEEVELESNGFVDKFVSRVYCNRDWKKEARRIHLDGSCRQFQRKMRPRRRDWKAEARKMKT